MTDKSPSLTSVHHPKSVKSKDMTTSLKEVHQIHVA